jgi:hypothetical protein
MVIDLEDGIHFALHLLTALRDSDASPEGCGNTETAKATCAQPLGRRAALTVSVIRRDPDDTVPRAWFSRVRGRQPSSVPTSLSEPLANDRDSRRDQCQPPLRIIDAAWRSALRRSAPRVPLGGSSGNHHWHRMVRVCEMFRVCELIARWATAPLRCDLEYQHNVDNIQVIAAPSRAQSDRTCGLGLLAGNVQCTRP